MPHDTEYENNPGGMVRRWRAELTAAHKSERDWREQGRKVIERYRDDADESRTDRRYNILWANTETLRPQMYSHTPEPVVQRRFHDKDPVGRMASETMQKALEYAIDAYDFDGTIDHCITDYLLPGRAIARIRYIPTFEQGEAPRITVQQDVQEDGTQLLYAGDDPVSPDSVMEDEQGLYMEGEAEEEVTYEEVRCEYVNWEDFRISPARTWGEVRWVAFRHRMTREELKEAFGEAGREVPLTIAPQETATEQAESQDTEHISKRAEVWEIWHKENREVIFIAEGKEDSPVEVREDPLNLDGFFPCPEPLYSVSTNNTMVPIPEYTLYQDQAQELNRITTRIDKLVEALKARGLYAGEHKDALSRLMKGEDNELIPVEDFAALQDGTLESRIAWMPIEQIAKTLQWLYQQRDQLLQSIYQITGIADIMRGASDPREGVGTQQMKGRFGVQRLQPRQKSIQKFVRDLLELKAEVMAEMFEPRTLSLMTGTEMPDQVLSLLRDDGLRGFRIDIETDSTVDDQEDKEEIAEAFNAMSSLAQNLQPMAQSGQINKEAVKEIFLWGMRRFRVSRQVESALEADPEPQKPEPPDPIEMEKLKNERMKIQQQAQKDQMEQRLKLMEIKREYAEMDSDEMQSMVQSAVKLAEEQDRMFNEAFGRIMDTVEREGDRQERQQAAQQTTGQNSG